MGSQAVRLSCGAPTLAHAGQRVLLQGWVNRRRDHGGLVFIDARDRDGITQVVFNPERAESSGIAQTAAQ